MNVGLKTELKTELKTKSSGVIKIVSIFDYKGVKVAIRSFYECYEYIFAWNGVIYTDYYELRLVKKKEDNQLLKDEAIRRLTTIATLTIDKFVKESKVGYKIKQLLGKLLSNAKKHATRWYFSFKPEKQASIGEVRVNVPANRSSGQG